MMRNLRILLLTVSAAFVLGVGGASAVSVTSESSPIRLTGSQIAENNNVITFPAGASKCKTVTYASEAFATPTTTVSITPTFGTCTVLGIPGTIHMNGCSFLFHISVGFSATSDIVCPAGQEITSTAVSAGTTKCTMHIPPQTGLSKTEGTNVGSGTTRELEIHLNASNIKATATSGTGLGSCTAGSQTGTLTGSLKLTGEKTTGTEHVGIFLA